MMEKMTLDDKLGLDSFCTDEGRSHIEIQKNFADKAELHRLVLACPAGLYQLDEEGNLCFSFEGCLECGTCRVIGGGGSVKSWDYPRGGMGICYKKG